MYFKPTLPVSETGTHHEVQHTSQQLYNYRFRTPHDTTITSLKYSQYPIFALHFHISDTSLCRKIKLLLMILFICCDNDIHMLFLPPWQHEIINLTHTIRQTQSSTKSKIKFILSSKSKRLRAHGSIKKLFPPLHNQLMSHNF